LIYEGKYISVNVRKSQEALSVLLHGAFSSSIGNEIYRLSAVVHHRITSIMISLHHAAHAYGRFFVAVK